MCDFSGLDVEVSFFSYSFIAETMEHSSHLCFFVIKMSQYFLFSWLIRICLVLVNAKAKFIYRIKFFMIIYFLKLISEFALTACIDHEKTVELSFFGPEFKLFYRCGNYWCFGGVNELKKLVRENILTDFFKNCNAGIAFTIWKHLSPPPPAPPFCRPLPPSLAADVDGFSYPTKLTDANILSREELKIVFPFSMNLQSELVH
ncbi:unnamed protein product [Citrullus colocynthis]|uniref:Uncharacterized protein n=1 Tax=Citrullus colocynthis TaxID=252529 RepID=A0ABP0YAS2_9ROSI